MIKSLANGQKPALIINEVQVGLLDKDRAIFPALAEIAAERNIVVIQFFIRRSSTGPIWRTRKSTP
jgi:hypothetical protein